MKLYNSTCVNIKNIYYCCDGGFIVNIKVKLWKIYKSINDEDLRTFNKKNQDQMHE